MTSATTTAAAAAAQPRTATGEASPRMTRNVARAATAAARNDHDVEKGLRRGPPLDQPDEELSEHRRDQQTARAEKHHAYHEGDLRRHQRDGLPSNEERHPQERRTDDGEGRPPARAAHGDRFGTGNSPMAATQARAPTTATAAIRIQTRQGAVGRLPLPRRPMRPRRPERLSLSLASRNWRPIDPPNHTLAGCADAPRSRARASSDDVTSQRPWPTIDSSG